MSGRVRGGVPNMCIKYSLLPYLTDKPKDVRIKLSIINTDKKEHIRGSSLCLRKHAVGSSRLSKTHREAVKITDTRKKFDFYLFAIKTIYLRCKR